MRLLAILRHKITNQYIAANSMFLGNLSEKSLFFESLLIICKRKVRKAHVIIMLTASLGGNIYFKSILSA